MGKKAPQAGGRPMNVDLAPKKPGDTVTYAGPHLCVTCANEGRITSRVLSPAAPAPLCDQCGARARWEP